MTAEATAFPSLLRFLWMFLMQPVSLHRRLASLGVDPESRPWKLWRSPSRFDRLYLRRSSVTLFVIMPLATAIVAGGLALFGVQVSWGRGAVGVALGVAGGVALGVVSLVFGVAVGMAFAMGFAVTFGARAGWGGLALGAAFGAIMNLPSGVAFGAVRNLARDLARALLLGMIAGMGYAVVFVLHGEVAGAVVRGLTVGVVLLAASLRLPIFCLEVLAQTAFYLSNGLRLGGTLRFSPVLYDELSYFPLPFLARHIEAAAPQDPELARRVLEACAIAPGQRRTGRLALARLQAREMEALARSRRFAAVAELQGFWLPGVAGADPLLLSFREAARYLAAALGASVPYHRIEHLKRAEDSLKATRNQLIAGRSHLARALGSSVAAWGEILAGIRQEAEAAAAHVLPNPFRAGEPLTPEQGREVFRGRERFITQIEALLADPHHSASLVLLGPRRCGKTSLLKMLPALLPDAQCVFFDLQDNPAGSPAAFFQALARRAQEQTQRDRRLTIPPLPPKPPLEAAGEWLEQLEALPGEHRILIAIDEFERLEELFPGDRRELLQLMGLFRATIQHRRRVRLLVSGAAPFDELDRMWDDHFINTRELRLTNLDEPTAVGLLTRPIPDFPPEAIPAEVAGAIYVRAGGQPYLLQLYGSLLVTRLNGRERRESTPEDIPVVEGEVLTQAAAYFRNTWGDAPQEARLALRALADGETPNLAPRVRRWLERRCLLTPEGGLEIPALGRWIREEAAE